MKQARLDEEEEAAEFEKAQTLRYSLRPESAWRAAGLGVVGRLLTTDGPYGNVLAEVRKSLGHDINFANQKDREAIGNAIVNHIRQTGGCDVAGTRANGCNH